MPTDLSTLLAELSAAVAKMTPGPWFVSGPFPNASIYEGRVNDYDRYDLDSGQLPPKWLAQGTYRCAKNIAEDHDIAGIVALVNSWPALREGIEQLQRRNSELNFEQQECSQVCTGLEIERDALRALVAQQREALRGLMKDGDYCCADLCDDHPHTVECEKARAVLAQEMPS